MELWLGLLALLAAVGPMTSYQSDNNLRKFGTCELAKELLDVYKFPRIQIATWVCIADKGSGLDSSYISSPYPDSPRQLGLFGIDNRKCLSGKNNAPKDVGLICNVTCDNLRDADISDDVKCVKQIYAENMEKNGNGFSSWEIYRNYCNFPPFAYSIIGGCRI